jgi:predicted transcriptional regulator
MAKGRPTPGPWWVVDRRLTHPTSGIKAGGDGLLIMAAPTGEGSTYCVASINNWGGGNEADADLIARAPELLEDEMNGARVTEETLRTLAAVAHYGEATAAQIRTRSGLGNGTLSPILARLEGRGWLAKRAVKLKDQPIRQYYRIADHAAVGGMTRRLLSLLGDLQEALS